MIKTLLILALATTALSVDCGKNCVSCTENGCEACFKSLWTEEGLCKLDATIPNNCLLTAKNEQSGAVGCVLCDSGFAMEPFTGTCVPGTVKNCEVEITIFGQYICAACNGTTPSLQGSTCDEGVADNCKWGSNNGGTVGCFRCEDGYLQNDGKCIVSTIEGCMASKDGGKTCTGCNAFNGYFATDFAVCTKQ